MERGTQRLTTFSPHGYRHRALVRACRVRYAALTRQRERERLMKLYPAIRAAVESKQSARD